MDTTQPEDATTETTLDTQEEVLIDADGDLVPESDFESPVAIADAASEVLADTLLSSADRASNSQAVELYGLVADADPNADVTAEVAALSDDDKQRMESLREMAQSEGLTFSDSQLLALLRRVAQMDSMSKAWGKKSKRKVDTAAVAKRRAANKAARAARKRNRR